MHGYKTQVLCSNIFVYSITYKAIIKSTQNIRKIGNKYMEQTPI